MKANRNFTTGEVAKICKVAARTVSKWFDSGKLRGYRIPGSQDRRIPFGNLVQFLNDHGMPLGSLQDEITTRVLVVSNDLVLIDGLTQSLQSINSSFEVAAAASAFDAGIRTDNFHPDAVVVDFSLSRGEALQVCQKLRSLSDYAAVPIIVLLPDDGDLISFDRSAITETFRRPFDPALLAQRLASLLLVK